MLDEQANEWANHDEEMGKNAMLHVRPVSKYLYKLQTISIHTKWKTHTYKLETSKLVKQKHLRKIEQSSFNWENKTMCDLCHKFNSRYGSWATKCRR